jgi:L-alanine-DL-glutamate epimerase-like enolase superfamily enzyme
VDGTIPLPDAPGLGVELDREALNHYAGAAEALA